jgi:serine/threonine-protein kinase RsbW
MAPVLAGVTRPQIEKQTLSVGRYRMLAGPTQPAEAVRVVEAAVEAARREAGPVAAPDTRTIHVELPSVVDLVQPLALYLTRECRSLGWPEEPLATAIPLCLTEALVNAVVHGNRESPARRVRAEIRLTPGQFWSNITDEGQGFDPVRVPQPTLQENLLREHGRGLFLMRHYMSEVSFNAKGNSVTLVRRIGPAGA